MLTMKENITILCGIAVNVSPVPDAVFGYPYYLMKENDAKAVLPICTDELNYHRYDHIHVRWDGLFEVGLMSYVLPSTEFGYPNSLVRGFFP